jgi:murein DD-endopeptidase MepM/ murein hydrolase activator NlpD
MSKKIFVPRPLWREKAWRLVIWLLGWIGIAMLFYVGFSFFFDTPLEYRMKRSTASMRREYDALSARYDSLEMVLDNVVDRDRNVFRILFESEPYDLDSDTVHWQTYEDLLGRSDRQLARELRAKTSALEGKMAEVDGAVGLMERHAAAAGSNVRYIPAIQPILNPGLTLLTASFGLRIQPFSKKLASHNGVDYTVPEGSRVFATAGGRVKDVMRSNSSSGLSIVIDHGGEYETQYSHLARAGVARGDRVERGDIIGLTGNTGLSLSPHLHYEVRHNGMPVDPIHYFFMELGPSDYRRIRQIARSGMQSFD